MNDNRTLHAIQRAKARYGLDLTAELHSRIIDSILCREAHLLAVQSENVSVWRVPTPKGVALVVFDAYWERLVTFLPRGKKDIRDLKLHHIDATL